MADRYDRRRDTPAQDQQFRDRQVRGDVSAFQQAGLYAQDRDNERTAVAGAVRGATQAGPQSYGNSGSPTLREAGQGAMQMGRDWVQQLRGSAPAPAPGIPPQTREADGVGAQRGAVNLPRGTGQGSGFTASQLAGQQPPRSGGRGPDFSTLQAGSQGITGPGAPTRMPQQEGIDWRGALGAAGRFLRGDIPPPPPGASNPFQPAPATQPASQAGSPGPQGRPSQQVLRDVNTTAVQSALAAGRQAEEAGRGIYTNAQGQQVTVPGTRRVQNDPTTGLPGISVMGNMGAASEEFARANAIRQQMIDSQRPQNQVTIIPDSGAQGAGGVEGRLQQLARQAGRTSNPQARARINSEIRALQGVAGRQSDESRTEATNLASLQRQGMADDAAFERAAMQSLATDPGQEAYQQARANYYNAQAQRAMRGEPLEPPALPDVQSLFDMGREDMVDQELARYQAERDQYDMLSFSQRTGVSLDEMLEDYQAGASMGPLEPIMERVYGPRGAPEENRYAAGGMVAPPSMEASMGPSAMGMDGMVGQGMGMGGPPPMLPEYERYVQGAQQIGVQAVPYEEFVNLMPQSQPMPEAAPGPEQPFAAMGFAGGGLIPGEEDMLASQIGATMGGMDVSGREVYDPDPNAPTDSIPAVIDGQFPAALDSGEFVIPEHVVRFHGVDKLQKLIAQAERGAGNGQSGTATAV